MSALSGSNTLYPFFWWTIVPSVNIARTVVAALCLLAVVAGVLVLVEVVHRRSATTVALRQATRQLHAADAAHG